MARLLSGRPAVDTICRGRSGQGKGSKPGHEALHPDRGRDRLARGRLAQRAPARRLRGAGRRPSPSTRPRSRRASSATAVVVLAAGRAGRRRSTRSSSRAASGAAGDPDVQFEIYRALEGTGALVVNRLDPLLAAQDKFRTSWLLRRRGRRRRRARRSRRRRTDAERGARGARRRGREARSPGSLGDGVERLRPDAAGRRARRASGSRGTGRSTSRSTSRTRGATCGSSWSAAARARRSRATRLRASGGPTSPAEGGREPVALGPALAAAAEAAAGALGLDYAGVDLVARARRGRWCSR